MKTTLLVAMLAVIGLTACEKTTVNPPAPPSSPRPLRSRLPFLAQPCQCLFQALPARLAPLAKKASRQSGEPARLATP